MEISQPRNAFRELFFKHASEDGKLEAKELKEFVLQLSTTGTEHVFQQTYTFGFISKQINGISYL